MTILTDNLMLTIVGRGQADLFTRIARECGCTGGTVYPAMGTASSAILRRFGLGDKSKEVILNVVSKDTAYRVIDRVKAESKIQGVSAILGSFNDLSSEEEMSSAVLFGEDGMRKHWTMITIIVNKGYADDIMDTARKAGASGGTISNARGTVPKGSEHSFLGITIVPEKEMVIILSERDKADAIVTSIKNMDCLQEKGIGVIFMQDVIDFVNLGNN